MITHSPCRAAFENYNSRLSGKPLSVPHSKTLQIRNPPTRIIAEHLACTQAHAGHQGPAPLTSWGCPSWQGEANARATVGRRAGHPLPLETVAANRSPDVPNLPHLNLSCPPRTSRGCALSEHSKWQNDRCDAPLSPQGQE